jgi:anti-anti-sigma factor
MYALEQLTEIAVLESAGVLVVRMKGDISAGNSVAVSEEIRAAWDDQAAKVVILDLWEVRRLDSSGMGVLMELASVARKSGVSLALCHLQDSPRRLLERTGLRVLFDIHGTVEEAISKHEVKH